MPYLELDGKRIFYAGDIKKEGIPILFCHGSGGRHHHWAYQLKGFRDKQICPIAVDLPGHGRSEGTPSASINEYRDWLHNFKETLGLKQFIPAGHSMGGAVTLAYSLAYPAEVLGLILVGSGGRLKVLPAFLDALREGSVPTSLIDYLYCPEADETLLQNGRNEISATAASIYYADLSACDKFDIMDQLSRIKQPALILCGSEDLLTPVRYSVFLESELPRGELQIIEGAGHMVMLEKPQEVNHAIEAFTEKINACYKYDSKAQAEEES